MPVAVCCHYCCCDCIIVIVLITCGSPGLSWFCRDRISTCSGTRGIAPGRNSFISAQRCSTLRAACSSISANSSGVRSFFFSRADNNNTAVRAVNTDSRDSRVKTGTTDGGCCSKRGVALVLLPFCVYYFNI